MARRTFADFLNDLEAASVASSDDLQGCAQSEIEALESRYGLALPDSYRSYLSTMGHRSGRLLTHDHYAATYEHVLRMTDEYRQDCIQYPDEPHVMLPPDALVIVGRLSEQFLMIRCNRSDDSAVWYFNEYEPNLKDAYSSVMDWLYSLVEEAKDAIDRGYYDMFPDGTRP